MIKKQKLDIILNLILINLKDGVNKHLHIYQMTIEEWIILLNLNELDNNGYLTLLSKNTRVSKSKVSKVINSLVNKNMIKRNYQDSLEDRRILKLSLTLDGIEHLAKIERDLLFNFDKFFKQFNNDEITTILKFIKYLPEIY